MKEYIKENKKTIIIILIFIIFIIILNLILNAKENDNQFLINTYIKQLELKDLNTNNFSCDITYTLQNNNIPYFNLNHPTYNELNNEILTESLLRSCYQEGSIDYEASLNDNLLSLAINISHETTHDLAFVEYKTYNINTKNNTKITNQQLLNIYKLTLQDVSNKVIKYFLNFYKYEKDNNLIDKTISFNDYLNILEFETITLDNMNLYVDNKNDLYIFKDYILSEGMSMDENFPSLSIKFKLT